ncbi:MAG: hypothetical protein QW728_02185, partial [Thermoplasmata archaeon]
MPTIIEMNYPRKREFESLTHASKLFAILNSFIEVKDFMLMIRVLKGKGAKGEELIRDGREYLEWLKGYIVSFGRWLDIISSSLTFTFHSSFFVVKVNIDNSEEFDRLSQHITSKLSSTDNKLEYVEAVINARPPLPSELKEKESDIERMLRYLMEFAEKGAAVNDEKKVKKENNDVNNDKGNDKGNDDNKDNDYKDTKRVSIQVEAERNSLKGVEFLLEGSLWIGSSYIGKAYWHPEYKPSSVFTPPSFEKKTSCLQCVIFPENIPCVSSKFKSECVLLSRRINEAFSLDNIDIKAEGTEAKKMERGNIETGKTSGGDKAANPSITLMDYDYIDSQKSHEGERDDVLRHPPEIEDADNQIEDINQIDDIDEECNYLIRLFEKFIPTEPLRMVAYEEGEESEEWCYPSYYRDTSVFLDIVLQTKGRQIRPEEGLRHKALRIIEEILR